MVESVAQAKPSRNPHVPRRLITPTTRSLRCFRPSLWKDPDLKATAAAFIVLVEVIAQCTMSDGSAMYYPQFRSNVETKMSAVRRSVESGRRRATRTRRSGPRFVPAIPATNVPFKADSSMPSPKVVCTRCVLLDYPLCSIWPL